MIPSHIEAVSTIAGTTPEVSKILTQAEVRAALVKAFPDAPIMVKIASCESHFRQFDKDGTVLRGKENPQDRGVFQINEYYHLAASKKMGIDIYTFDGNIKYARYLYDHQGVAPWGWSEYMWSVGECK